VFISDLRDRRNIFLAAFALSREKLFPFQPYKRSGSLLSIIYGNFPIVCADFAVPCKLCPSPLVQEAMRMMMIMMMMRINAGQFNYTVNTQCAVKQ